MKSKIVKIVSSKWFLIAVAAVLGRFGIHRFIMKKWGTGILMLLLSVTGLSSYWAAIDIILILTGKLKTKATKQEPEDSTVSEDCLISDTL